MQKNSYIKGLPYTGSKYKLLSQLLPLFPENINTFIEPFTGGCNIAPNIKANKYLLNDLITPLIDLYQVLQEAWSEWVIEYLEERVKEFNLNKENKEGYNQFRELYNNNLKKHNRTQFLILDFFLLICHSFNNQIRFNKKGEFNLPFGSRTFNDELKKNLNNLIDFFKTNDNNIGFNNMDGLKFLRESIINTELNDFIYLDPPYLDTTATYNEQDGWNNENEFELFIILCKCIIKDIKFSLSNIMINDTIKSEPMQTFINLYSQHICIYKLDKNYKNCNHQKSSTNVLQEIYITNVGVNKDTSFYDKGFLTLAK